MTNAEKALAELVTRNPIRSDMDDYAVEVALWGLGLRKDRPDPTEYGQLFVSQDDGANMEYAKRMAE